MACTLLTVICNCKRKHTMICTGGEDGVAGECRSVAVRAYRELRSRGLGDVAAFDASVRVYQHHHPGSATDRARDRVAHWIEEDIENAGATPDGAAAPAIPSA